MPMNASAARKQRRYQIVGFTLGMIILILGAFLLLPAFVDWRNGHANAGVFFQNAVFCLFFGGALAISNRNFERHMTVREAFVLTNLSWWALAIVIALPYTMVDIEISFTDALFEAMSGITTTGSTVFAGLDAMSHGILFWRSISHFIGGIGIVAFAMVLLPFLKVGGMQLFQTESSDKSEKALPRSIQIVSALMKIYFLITAVGALVFYMLGMSLFDAVNHSMAAVATGGFSTSDSNFGKFNDSDPLLLTATLLMFMGGLPFILYVKILYRGNLNLWKDEQFRYFTIMVAALTLVLSLWMWMTSEYSLWRSFVLCIFNIVSVLTTTGFTNVDYLQWGSFPILFFLFLTYLGACAGSTAGGIKMMRLIIVARATIRHIKNLIYPSAVFPVYYQKKPLDSQIIMDVAGFLALYVTTNVIITILLTLCGLDFETALSGAATAIANVGPGIGPIIGPVGNFSTLPDSAKWILTLGMLLGRLEIMTVLVLFSPHFWRR